MRRARCYDSRTCFAKVVDRKTSRAWCEALSQGYPDGKCPFCKGNYYKVDDATLDYRIKRKGVKDG